MRFQLLGWVNGDFKDTYKVVEEKYAKIEIKSFEKLAQIIKTLTIELSGEVWSRMITEAGINPDIESFKSTHNNITVLKETDTLIRLSGETQHTRLVLEINTLEDFCKLVSEWGIEYLDSSLESGVDYYMELS